MKATQIAGLPRRSGEAAIEARRGGGSNSVVESQPSKLLVAGSIPVSRSSLRHAVAPRVYTSAAEAGFGWTSQPCHDEERAKAPYGL